MTLSLCTFGTAKSFAEYKICDVLRCLNYSFADVGWDVQLLHNRFDSDTKNVLCVAEPPSNRFVEMLTPYLPQLYWLRIWPSVSRKQLNNSYNPQRLHLLRQCAGVGSLLAIEVSFLKQHGIECTWLPLGSHPALRTPHPKNRRQKPEYDIFIQGEGQNWQYLFLQRLETWGISYKHCFGLPFVHRDDALRKARRVLILPQEFNTQSVTPPHLVAMSLYHQMIPLSLCEITESPFGRWCQQTNLRKLTQDIKYTPPFKKSFIEFRNHAQKRLLSHWQRWLK